MSIPLPRFSLIRFVFLLVPLFFVPAVEAQEKSVNPGINAPYEKDPDAKKFVGTFEVESREAFNFRKEIVAACRLKPGMSVADVGAGTGLFTRLFAAEVAPGGTVYAADIAANFLKHIETTCKETRDQERQDGALQSRFQRTAAGLGRRGFPLRRLPPLRVSAEDDGHAPCRPEAGRPAGDGRLSPREGQDPGLVFQTRPRRAGGLHAARSRRPDSSSKARRSFSKTTT